MAAERLDNTDKEQNGPDQVGSQKVIYAAIVANIGIAIAKFIVAGISGSAAMLAEGIHSAVDTGNELLLLLGARRSNRPADDRHPFGYGKVAYFWALIVAMSVFALGGGVSIYHGIVRLQDPPLLENPTWNYIVLAVAAVFEAYSWNVSRRALNVRRREGESLWHVVRRSKDASVFTVFIEDSAALTGIAIAFAGVWLGHVFGNRYLDPAASIGIGLVLIAAAVLLARETGGLLVGESIDREQIARLRKIVVNEPAVDSAGRLLTMQLGPDEALLAVEVRFKRGLRIDEVDRAIERLERSIAAHDPTIRHVFFEARAIKSSLRPSSSTF